MVDSLPTQLEDIPMHADIVDRPALRVVTCAHKGPYNRISEAFDRSCSNIPTPE